MSNDERMNKTPQNEGRTATFRGIKLEGLDKETRMAHSRFIGTNEGIEHLETLLQRDKTTLTPEQFEQVSALSSVVSFGYQVCNGGLSQYYFYLQYLSYQLLAALIRNSAGHAAYCKRNPADNSLDGIMSSSDGGLWNGGSSIKTTSCSICMNTMENLTTPLLLGGFRCREAACQRTQSVRLETLQCYVMITMRAMAISRASSAPLAMLWASSATTEATGDGWSPMKGRPGANRSWRSRGCAASRASRSTPSSQGSSPPAPQTPQASARKSRAITPSAR